MTAIINGSSPSVTFSDGTTQATSAIVSGYVPYANLPAGSVLQVVNTNKTDTFTSSASTTWTDITGMSATITPRFSSSKVLITISFFGVLWQQGYNGCILRLLRNATSIGGGDAAGSRTSCIGTSVVGTLASNTDCGIQYSLSFVDTPSTTSSTTYKLQFYQDTPSAPIYVGRSKTDSDTALWPRTASSIILTEIAG